MQNKCNITVCRECGKEYERKDEQNNGFCSERCRRNYRKKHPQEKDYQKICRFCGQTFETNNQADIYCSLSCRKKAEPWKYPYECVCQYCGELFMAKTENSRFCSSKCAACFHAEETRKPPEERPRKKDSESIKICRQCGREYHSKKRGREDHGFCSKSCADKYRYYNNDKPLKYEKICECCGTKYETNRMEQRYCSRECAALEFKPEYKRVIHCAVCGVEIVGALPGQVYCQSCADSIRAQRKREGKELADAQSSMSANLTGTETRVSEQVNAAEQSMKETEAAMNDAVEQMTARLEANVSASTDADADYAAEVADARVDEEGMAHENLGNAIRSIPGRVEERMRTEMKAEDKRSFHAQLAEHYADLVLESCDQAPYGEIPNYNVYSTSTFSGWVTEYTATEPMLVTGVSCFVKARENPISKVRIAVALDERMEAKNIYEETLDMTIEAETAADVSCEFSGVCLEVGQKLYILCEADAICSHGFSNKVFDEYVSWYSTNGRMAVMENCQNGSKRPLCLILHGYSMTLPRTDRLEKSIRAEAVRIDTVEKRLSDSFSEEPVLENVQDLIPVLSPAPTYATSTFTGWAGPIGPVQNFNTLIFEIINRETNPGYVEKIRCVISVFGRDGEVLADETLTGFHIAPGERRKVLFRFTEPILNTEGLALYAGFTCDQWITVVYGSTGINLNAPDYGHVCYTSHNAEPPKLNTEPISAWQSLHDPNLTNKSKPILYTAYCSEMLLLSEQHLKQIDAHIAPKWNEIDASIQEQKQKSDEFEETVAELQTAFPEQMLVTEVEDLLPIKSEKLNYNTSTFTGWGAPIGPVKHFNALRFSVLNREENTGDITTIRCVVSVFDKSGEILADKTLTDFHIAPGEKADILFPLDVMIENESGAQIYAGFACDQHIGIYVGSPGVNLNPPDYGKVTYLAMSGEAPYSVTKELSRWTDIYDPNLTNKSKCNIRPALVEQARLLGENQVAQVERIVEEKMGNVPLSEMQKEQVKELAMGATEYPPRVVLPDRFLAVAGDTLQLFYRGIVEHPNPYIYNIHFKCAIGKNTSRYFEVTPTAEQVGKHTLTVEVRNHLDMLLTSASTVLEVVKVAKTPTAEKNILCIGDSLTSGGYWPAEAHRRLTAADGTPVGHGLGNIRFIGTKKRGTTGYEGYGGWTWASYLAAPSETTSDMWVYADHDKDSSDQHSIWKDENESLWQMETIEEKRIKFTRYNGHTADMPAGNGTLVHSSSAMHTADIMFTATSAADKNPFWDTDADAVNFKSYCERNGFAGIDYVYMLLTWNGLTGYQAEADSAHIAKHVENAKTLLRMLHRDYPNARVGLMGIQMPSLNGGTGANYGANGGYSNAYSLVRTVMGMNLAYQAMANEEEFAPYVEFIHVSGQFDSENNMPTVSKPVNTRSTITEKVGSNGVHPTVDGYMQIADAVYRHMVAELNR